MEREEAGVIEYRTECPWAYDGAFEVCKGLHRLVLPCLLFAIFFDWAVLDPTDVGWLIKGDLGAHFVGWTAFQHDAWRWPIGYSELIAYPTGMPLTATDSNPLMAVPLKLLSPLMPDYCQFIGIWYLLCLLLSYNIALNLLTWLSGRPVPAALAAVILITAPYFFLRVEHDTLMAQWLILASFSIFLRPNSDFRAIAKYAGVTGLSMAVHPYFMPMTFAVAGMDMVRRAYRRYQRRKPFVPTLRFLAAGLAVLLAVTILVSWILGILSLETTGKHIGIFTMDPLAWFNGWGASAFLRGWGVGEGQYEGAQYLGAGALIAVISAAMAWTTGLARPPETVVRSLPWLLPAVIVLAVIAISPVVRVAGHTLVSVNVFDWPVIGTVLSMFRGSGRFGWPASYLVVLVALSLWLSIHSRAVGPLLTLLACLQISDLLPIASYTRQVTQSREVRLEALASSDKWEILIESAARVHISPGTANLVMLELAYLTVGRGKSVNRSYYAQDIRTALQAAANEEAHARLRGGEFEDGVLYVLNPSDIPFLLNGSADKLERLRQLDGLLVVTPGTDLVLERPDVPYHAASSTRSLYDTVDGCKQDCAIVISVRDEATAALPPEFAGLIDQRGGKLGTLGYRGSYAVILKDGRVVEEAIAQAGDVTLKAELFGQTVDVMSGGGNGSNWSSINVNGREMSPNRRGINLLRIGPSGVSGINAYDTYADPEAALVP